MAHNNGLDALKKIDKFHMDNNKRLKREHTMYREIVNISREMVHADFEDILKKIITVIIRLTGADQGFIMISGSGGKLKSLVGTADDLFSKGHPTISESIAREVLNSGQSTLLENIEADNTYSLRKSIVKLGIKAVMCVPIKNERGTIGALYIDTRQKDHNFSKDDLQFFQAFASQAAIAIDNARGVDMIKEENKTLRRKNNSCVPPVICESRAMKKVLHICGKTADNTVSVLLTGETGTGKDVIARYIHYNSDQKQQPFIPVDCGALTDELLESQLFGYTKGAFTGAVADKKGLFAAAQGGTIFLDEINKATIRFQKKLLRVLESRMVRPVGSVKEFPVDVRVITASNKDLERMVEEGDFLEDLYFRLKVFFIEIPPLRERKEDIPAFIRHFVDCCAKEMGKEIAPPSPDFLDQLTAKKWPGNVRELRNNILRRILLSEDGQLTAPPDQAATSPPQNQPLPSNVPEPFPSLKEIEIQHITRALDKAGGNVMETARLLQMKRGTLIGRMNKYGISKE